MRGKMQPFWKITRFILQNNVCLRGVFGPSCLVRAEPSIVEVYQLGRMAGAFSLTPE
jgi:hypothetical protein